MNRAEILAKSRTEQEDEGVQHIWKTGMIWGYASMILTYPILYLVTSLINEDKLDLLQPARIIWFCALGFQWLGNGKTSRRGLHATLGVWFMFLGIVEMILYISYLLG
jgi:hypothetical protein